MRNSPTILAASAAALLTLAAACPAHALGPVGLEIAGKLGYGSNHLDLGLGGRAGVSYLGFYGGVTIVNYFGQDSTSALTWGGELGYGFRIAFITIRPLVGFGDEALTVPQAGACVGPNCGSSPAVNTFYVQPGGLLQFGFEHVIFGVDAGAFIPTASGERISFTVNGELGARF